MPYEGRFISFDGQGTEGHHAEDRQRQYADSYQLYLWKNTFTASSQEMNMQNPLEALKAKPFTARTFAVVSKDRHASEGFNLCATTHCQVYGGVKDEYPSTNRAVDETRGEIIRYNGEAAEIYYHKNSGGHTQNSEDVWSAYAPHLRGIPDPYSPEYPWSAVISFSSLQQKLIQAQLDPGPVESVRIGGRDSSGAVSSLIIRGEDREVQLTKSRIRAVLGSSLVRSRHFSIGEVYEGETAQKQRFTDIAFLRRIKNIDGSNPIYILSEKERGKNGSSLHLFDKRKPGC